MIRFAHACGVSPFLQQLVAKMPSRPPSLNKILSGGSLGV
jgi:hypothetical protein